MVVLAFDETFADVEVTDLVLMFVWLWPYNRTTKSHSKVGIGKNNSAWDRAILALDY